MRRRGHEPTIAAKTGLLLDPYFSATKLAWILDNVAGARDARASRTSWRSAPSTRFLLWRLTGGKVHATDATNASRTLLYDIRRGAWDEDLCELFGVPMALLPQVRDCAGEFGATEPVRRLDPRSWASPAISRPRPSGRDASSPA